jgi:feruloyl esterase
MIRPGLILLASTLASYAQSQCERLQSLSLPNATVTTAQLVPAGPFQAPGTPAPPAVVLPSHCRVAAVLAPSSDSHIEIEVWMPAENWNGKFEAVGNGGWAGEITYGSGAEQAIERSLVAALKAGYATASTDTGHNATETPRASFALGHPEKLIDYADRAIHEMVVRAKAIITAYYGRGPTFSYWNGCSTGGRQGLLEAQRYPGDFDGIAAGAPANYWTHLMSGMLWSAQATHAGQPGNMPKAKLELLHKTVIRACDAADGVSDGVLEDPTGCHFDPKVLACKGTDGPACLSAPQVEAVRKMYSGPIHPRTKEQIYPGMAQGSELGWDPVRGLQPFFVTESYFRYVVFKDPNWDYRTLNFDSGVALADRIDGGMITAASPDLNAFFSHGGKLIQYHGWNDQSIAPLGSVTYYKSVEKQVVGDMRQSFRLFMIPGMMHCGGGDGPDHFDVTAALEKWVETGEAPNQILASHVKDGKVDRTRPLCPYPQVAKYKGTGSTDDAANFSCALP